MAQLPTSTTHAKAMHAQAKSDAAAQRESAESMRTHVDTDAKVVGTELYFLPVQTRVPLKFGSETLTSVTCARVCVTIADRQGRTATGWGETPLNVEWVWPSKIDYRLRHQALLQFCETLAQQWADFGIYGHPLEIGYSFQTDILEGEILSAPKVGASREEQEPLPLLAGLLCCSPFDLALYDAYGKLHGKRVFETLNSDYLNYDLSHYLEPACDSPVSFANQYPEQYLVAPETPSLPAWHLVGGLDPIHEDQLTGKEPSDGHPVLLSDWIERDGLRCLKIKLRGTDSGWDYDRIVAVGKIASEQGVTHLTADFNCTVTDPQYVVDILDRLAAEEPEIFELIRYIEQPFPYDLEDHRIDVSEVSRRKLLLMDESAHNWQLVRLGHSLGWTGVALKTCKTLTGALLSLCWAKSHGMQLMVQDLTNPMLAQIPHVLLAAHAETLMGVETNAMQFYPGASEIEGQVHPGLYQRREGNVDFSTLQGPGFGYRVEEINRVLPPAACKFGQTSSS